MEKILEGLLLINNQDVYLQYGAFLTEDKQGDYSNYSALLKPPSMKDYPAVVYRERDGEELPEVLPQPRFEARDVPLYFAIVFSKVDGFKYDCRKLIRLTGCIIRNVAVMIN